MKKALLLTMLTLSIAVMPQVIADTIDEIVVTSPRVSTSGSRWILNHKKNALVRRIQQQDIDDADRREENCENIEKIARLECEVKVLSRVTGRVNSCSSHLATPRTTTEYEANTRILNGRVTVETAGGEQLYGACIDGVNAYKETQLKQCQLLGKQARQKSRC